MAGVGDALGTGLVASLNQPGGNVTGATRLTIELMQKSLGLDLRGIPIGHRNRIAGESGRTAGSEPFTKEYVAQIDQSGRRLGLQIEHFMQRPADRQEPAFESMKAKAIDALIVGNDPLFIDRRNDIGRVDDQATGCPRSSWAVASRGRRLEG